MRSLDCSKPQLCALWKRGGGVTYLWKYLHCVLSFNRISLLMYKNYADILPTAISSLFRRNDVYHDHYTRVSSLLHVPVGHTGLIYKTLDFRR